MGDGNDLLRRIDETEDPKKKKPQAGDNTSAAATVATRNADQANAVAGIYSAYQAPTDGPPAADNGGAALYRPAVDQPSAAVGDGPGFYAAYQAPHTVATPAPANNNGAGLYRPGLDAPPVADGDAPGLYAAYQAPHEQAPPVVAPGNVVTAPTRVNEHGTTVRPLGNFYANEQNDASPFRGAPGTWQGFLNSDGPGAPTASSVSTRYMNADEQAQSAVVNTSPERKYADGGTDKGLLRRPDGTLYDTSDASGKGTELGAGLGKHIFALTPEGQVRAVDPWASKHVTPKADGTANIGFVNHSSLVRGGEVASSGELTVREGHLQQISDSSGHYRPNGVMMKQAFDHFGAQGVDTSQVDVRFGAKTHGDKPVIASSAEFMSYADPNAAEAGMRTRRSALKREIAAEAKKRENRVGLNRTQSTDELPAAERAGTTGASTVKASPHIARLLREEARIQRRGDEDEEESEEK
jgi:hypothetical protein